MGALHGALAAESQSAAAAAANAKLERELQEFRAEAHGIQNQALTIRKLEERCRALEADVAAKVRARAPYCYSSQVEKFGFFGSNFQRLH